MLVDDDEDVRGVLHELLSGMGFSVQAYAGGDEALPHLTGDAAPDVLVTDLAMPGTDGLALIAEAQRRRPGLPAILMTGYGGGDLLGKTASVTGGPVAVLQKPVRAAVLAAEVERLLA